MMFNNPISLCKYVPFGENSHVARGFVAFLGNPKQVGLQFRFDYTACRNEISITNNGNLCKNKRCVIRLLVTHGGKSKIEKFITKPATGTQVHILL